MILERSLLPPWKIFGFEPTAFVPKTNDDQLEIEEPCIKEKGNPYMLYASIFIAFSRKSFQALVVFVFFSIFQYVCTFEICILMLVKIVSRMWFGAKHL